MIPICTPAGGIPDVIQDESIGFLAKDFSEKGLREAILKCLSGIDKFDKTKLMELFSRKYSIEKCAQEYEVIYLS